MSLLERPGAYAWWLDSLFDVRDIHTNRTMLVLDTLKQIDKYAKEEKINLWAPSSKY